MAYVTYTTDAIVCGTYDRNTADRSYRLFTRELGMLYADARSVRLEKSRQRAALQDFSHIKVSLVKGKGGWKIGSVTSLANFYHQACDQAARGSVVTIIRLLRRFVAGEEAHVDLFDEYIEALQFFAADQTNRQCYEEVFTQRVLASLGYIKSDDVPTEIQDVPLAAIPTTDVCRYSASVARSIEQAQHASQL